MRDSAMKSSAATSSRDGHGDEMEEKETRWARKARLEAEANTAVVGAHSYREHFKRHGRTVLDDSSLYDWRRYAVWAPYVVLPGVAVTSRVIPKERRPQFWVGTLICYSLFSTIMYNSDTSSGE